MATEPWKPASLISVNKKLLDPNYQYRWVSKTLLDRRVAEGWEVVKATGDQLKALAPEQTIVHGGPLDGTVQKPTLILCRMPKEMAASRAKYYQEQDAKARTALKPTLHKTPGYTPHPTHDKIEVKDATRESSTS